MAQVGGLRLDNYRTTLPLKKGLSSSAAICVLVRLTCDTGCHSALHSIALRYDIAVMVWHHSTNLCHTRLSGNGR